MIDSYWDLYKVYIAKCVKENKERNIDPHHHNMEWNHFLPQCLFGNQPVGHFLTLKQHAIASALQTLSFRKNCLCGWHKKYLSEALLEISWGYFVSSSKENAVKGAVKMNQIIHAERDEFGRSVFAMRSLANTYQGEKDERGISLDRIRNGVRLHSEKDEFGRSAVAVRVNNQVWESTKDGFRSNAGCVARHNKLKGWDPKDRVRIA